MYFILKKRKDFLKIPFLYILIIKIKLKSRYKLIYVINIYNILYNYTPKKEIVTNTINLACFIYK